MTDTQTQVDPAQEKLDAVEITLTFKVKEINGLLSLLGNVPFVQSAGFIQAIQAQGGPQVEAAMAADTSVVTDVEPTAAA